MGRFTNQFSQNLTNKLVITLLIPRSFKNITGQPWNVLRHPRDDGWMGQSNNCSGLHVESRRYMSIPLIWWSNSQIIRDIWEEVQARENMHYSLTFCFSGLPLSLSPSLESLKSEPSTPQLKANLDTTRPKPEGWIQLWLEENRQLCSQGKCK